jgi:hypothetical protein
MNKDMCYICLFVILFTLYLRSEYNTNSKIEKMSNSSDIKAQLQEIYKADVQSIRNLAEISQKLQKGGLEIPGKLTANNIQSNTLVSLKNSLETKLNALQRNLTTLTNQSNSKFSQVNSKIVAEVNGINSRFKARFPKDNEINFPNFGMIVGGGAYFHFTGPNRKGSKKVAFQGGSHGAWPGW